MRRFINDDNNKKSYGPFDDNVEAIKFAEGIGLGVYRINNVSEFEITEASERVMGEKKARERDAANPRFPVHDKPPEPRHDRALGEVRLHVKLRDNEPFFLLRAQDRFAPGHVDAIADVMEKEGVAPEKVQSARAIAENMRAWQMENTRKTPD